MYDTKKTRLRRIEARRRPAAAAVDDRSRWDWYAKSCSCGLPPGECGVHPRAGRPSGPPRATGGSVFETDSGTDWQAIGFVIRSGSSTCRFTLSWARLRGDAPPRDGDPGPTQSPPRDAPPAYV